MTRTQKVEVDTPTTAKIIPSVPKEPKENLGPKIGATEKCLEGGTGRPGRGGGSDSSPPTRVDPPPPIRFRSSPYSTDHIRSL